MTRSAALVVATVLSCGHALAQTCPNIEDGAAAVGAADGQQRIDYLMGTLPRTQRNTGRWAWIWTGTFTALTAGQLVAIPLTEDPAQQRALWVNSASTAIGALFFLVAPPPGMRLERRIQRRSTPEPPSCEKLAIVERELVSASQAERFGKGWLTHAGNLLLNTGAGLILALGWDDWENAWVTTTIGTAVGEAMIWTQPMNATQTLQRYRTGAWLRPTSPRLSLQVQPMPVRQGAAVGFAVAF